MLTLLLLRLRSAMTAHSISIPALCIIGFILLVKPSSASREVRFRPCSPEHGRHQLSILKLPRRMKLTEEAVEVKGHATEDIKSHNNHEEDNPGYPVHREHEARREHGARKKGTYSSHFFTMDYAPVRKRPPIHNKSLPVGP